MPYTGRDPVSGKRKYLKIMLAPTEFQKVRASVLYGLGLDHLTEHL